MELRRAFENLIERSGRGAFGRFPEAPYSRGRTVPDAVVSASAPSRDRDFLAVPVYGRLAGIAVQPATKHFYFVLVQQFLEIMANVAEVFGSAWARVPNDIFHPVRHNFAYKARII